MKRLGASLNILVLPIAGLLGTIAVVMLAPGSVYGQALSITTPSPLPTGAVGAPYSVTLAASGGVGPYTWSVAAGSSLPNGLILNANTGVLSGTPTTAGSPTFTIQVNDAASPAVTKPFSMTINGALTITTSSPLPTGAVGAPYSVTFTASGGLGDYTWSVAAGSLPSGLGLNPNTGVLSGTPTTAGNPSFTIQVNDAASAPVTKPFSLPINEALTITTNSPLPTGAVGAPYSVAFSASGGVGARTWSVALGSSLPGGLSLNASTGVLSGIPTASGNPNFTIQVNDAASPAVTKSFSATINVELAITTASPLPPSAVGAPYSVTMTSVGGVVSSHTWSLASGSTLPLGLTLTPTGVLSGTPTTVGTGSFTFDIQVTDGVQPKIKQFSLAVNPQLAMTTNPPLPPGVLLIPYSMPLAASGGVPPYNWSMAPRPNEALPDGLDLNPSTGLISGTPTKAGNFTFTVGVGDSVNSPQVNRTFTIPIAAEGLVITTSILGAGIQNQPYAQQFTAAGGAEPYTWTIISGSLPSGLSMTSAGVITGTPPVVGGSTFTVRVADSQGRTNTREFTLVVGPPVGTLTLTGLPSQPNPAQQLGFGLTLSSTHPTLINGTLTLSFSSTAVIPADDPAVGFSSGSRTVGFTINANTTSAVFEVPPLLLTGTVMGTISVRAAIQNGPSNMALGSLTVQSTAPEISSVTATRSSGQLRVRTVAFSPERKMTDAAFDIDVRTAAGTQRVHLARSVESEFGGWYQNPMSGAFGSTVLYEQLFVVQGDVSTLEAVTVTLTNSQGSRTSTTVPVTGN